MVVVETLMVMTHLILLLNFAKLLVKYSELKDTGDFNFLDISNNQ